MTTGGNEMDTVTTTTGERYYIGWAVHQADGSTRYLCGSTAREAREIRDTIKADPAMIDGVRCIAVDYHRRTASDAARALRAIPSETRAETSRANGRRGGRPPKADWVIEDATGLGQWNWPGCRPYRHRGSRRGYATEEEAARRAWEVTTHYNTTHGCSPGDLRVVRRERRD